ncbi:MAG TPA: hypothetical protein VFK80_06105 [Limnochordia bacterium]|nr:hypothetical protein [Limnochordia bacterium]
MGAATATYDSTHGNLYEAQSFGQPMKFASGTLVMNASYATGGDTLDLSDRFASLQGVVIAPTGGYTFEYDYTNGKVMAYYGDNNNAADGPGVEVAAATDLSAIGLDSGNIRFLAWGV